MPSSEAYSPLPFSDFFDESLDFDVDSGDGEAGSFRVYSSGLGRGRAPQTVFVLLHGAGMAALSWACAAKALVDAAVEASAPAPPAPAAGRPGGLGGRVGFGGPSGGLGGPSGGLDGGLGGGGIGIIAPDMRGHGHTRHGGVADGRLDIETLTRDADAVVAATLRHYYAAAAGRPDSSSSSSSSSSGVSSSGSRDGPTGPSAVILVGHSLGGAVATRLSHRRALEADQPLHPACATAPPAMPTPAEPAGGGARSQWPAGAAVRGLALFDCVEEAASASLAGPAAEALAAMPPAFATPGAAVAWAHHAGGVRNLASARVSTPPRLTAAVGPGPSGASGGQGGGAGGEGGGRPWR